MRFDVPTGYLFLGLTDWLMALTLLFAVRDRLRPGEGIWILALLTQGVGHVMLMLRGHVPLMSSIVLGNLGLCGGLALAYVALSRMLDARPLAPAVGAPLVATLATSLLFRDNSHARVVLYAVIYGAQCALLVWQLTRERSRALGGNPLRLIAIGYALGAGLFLTRALSAARVPDYNRGVFPPNGLDTFAVVSSFALIIATGVGVILLNREAMAQETERLATLDGLTGIYNRRVLMDLGSRALAQASRKARPLAMLMLDLDHFKEVNDSYGHQAGDAVLQGTVACIQSELRPHDLLARYGGEEFCVLLPETDAEGARTLAERIRRRVEDHVTLIDGRPVRVTISIGVAAAPSDHTPTVSELLALSDRALYAAKTLGRNQVVVRRSDRAQDSVEIGVSPH